MGNPKTKPLPDWDPKGPPGKVKPRTFDQKVADDLKELERAKKAEEQTLKEWRAEAERKRKARQEYEKAHETQWMDRRTKCVASLGMLSSEIQIRKNKWANTAIDLAKAYENAFTSFGKLLDEETNQNQLFWNIAFTALSSVAAGGLVYLSKKVGDKWARTEAQQLFVSAANDAVQTGVGGMLGIASPLVAGKLEATAIPSPLTFRGELEKVLNNLETIMLEWCLNYQQIVKDLDLAEFEDFTPERLDQAIKKFLAEKDRQYNAEPFPLQGTAAELTAELEKLMLGQWTITFCERELGRSSWAVRRRLPKNVIDKLVKVGYLSDSGHYSSADVLRLADWGPNTARTMRGLIQSIKTYQPKKFG